MSADSKEHIDWPSVFETQPTLRKIPPRLRSLAERWAVDAGTVLFRIGDQVQAVFSVIQGEVRLVRRNRDGAEVILQRVREGFFAEASLNSAVYHCDVLAAEAGVLLRFPAKDFRVALDADSAFRDAWMAQLASEVRKLRAKCERLSLYGASDRVLHYLESEGCEGGITLRQSKKAWAAELGLTHEALYRALRRLQDSGAIEVDGIRVTLKLL